MKRFILFIGTLILLTLGSIAFVFTFVNGTSDPFYLKVASKQQSNLILGTSNAAQGIQPQVLKQHLGADFYNFSFSVFVSPYGPVYLESIKKKLDTTSTGNTFILAIDVWSLSVENTPADDSAHFRENQSFLASLSDINTSPNYEYLLDHFDDKYYKILTNNSRAILNEDGWLEVNMENDSSKIARRTEFTINDYRQKMETYQFSKLRYEYLIETINYLGEYGKVYLVQLPVHPDLYEIESTLLSSFNSNIEEVTQRADGYLDMTPQNKLHKYTDGVHLNKLSGEKVSSQIAKWIKSIE